MARKRSSLKKNHNNQQSDGAQLPDAPIAEKGVELYVANDEHDQNKEQGNEHRANSRTHTKIKAIVQFHLDSEQTWKEVTSLDAVSKSGATFKLTRRCEIGILVALVMPLPVVLRAYDLTEEFYPVIGLVQYCYPSAADGGEDYSVGVAFVGKSFPDGHEANPTQNYHISGTTPSGMWQITPSGSKFKIRSAPRFWVPMDVTVAHIKRDRYSNNYKEQAALRNVSTSGASVVCSLNLQIGDRIKFASEEHDFYSIGIIRNRQVELGNKAILHIEFVDHRFPVEKLVVPRVTAVTT